MASWVDQTWSSSPTQGSLTHYFNEMSGNELHFTGKTVHAVAPNTRDWYQTNYGIYARGNVHKDIIDALDATWDFGEFDNWDFIDDYDHDNVADTYVDMIIFIWRNVRSDKINPEIYANDIGFGHDYGDMGLLDGNNNVSSKEISVDNGNRKVRLYYGGTNSIPLGSGVTVRQYLTADPFMIAIHEFAHYLLGGNELHTVMLKKEYML